MLARKPSGMLPTSVSITLLSGYIQTFHVEELPVWEKNCLPCQLHTVRVALIGNDLPTNLHIQKF